VRKDGALLEEGVSGVNRVAVIVVPPVGQQAQTRWLQSKSRARKLRHGRVIADCQEAAEVRATTDPSIVPAHADLSPRRPNGGRSLVARTRSIRRSALARFGARKHRPCQPVVLACRLLWLRRLWRSGSGGETWHRHPATEMRD
jgi:hypothetical protein